MILYILFAASIVSCFGLVMELIFWESAPIIAKMFYLLSHVTSLEDNAVRQKNNMMVIYEPSACLDGTEDLVPRATPSVCHLSMRGTFILALALLGSYIVIKAEIFLFYLLPTWNPSLLLYLCPAFKLHYVSGFLSMPSYYFILLSFAAISLSLQKVQGAFVTQNTKPCCSICLGFGFQFIHGFSSSLPSGTSPSFTDICSFVSFAVGGFLCCFVLCWAHVCASTHALGACLFLWLCPFVILVCTLTVLWQSECFLCSLSPLYLGMFPCLCHHIFWQQPLCFVFRCEITR